MLTSQDILHDVLQQLAIHLIAPILAGILRILLDGPDSPQGNVGLFNFVNLDAQRFVVHEFAQALLSGLHH